MRSFALRSVIFVASVSFLLLFGQGTHQAEATSFNPITPMSFCNVPFDADTGDFGTPTGCNYTPETPFNSTSVFTIPAPDSNFSSLVVFYPLEMEQKAGTDLPLGAVMGQLKSATNLGILNSACNQPVVGGANFTMQNGSVDTSPAEPAYRDVDTSNDVSIGDVRLTGSKEFAVGTTVAAAESDIGTALVAFAANEKHTDPANPNVYDVGEEIYRDVDTSGDVSVDDLRLFPEVTTAISGDWDIGTALVAFAANEMHVDEARLNANVYDTTWVAPYPAGTSNRFFSLREDNDNNGLPDGADKMPDYIAKLFDPDFINVGPDGFLGGGDDVDGPLPPIAPHSRFIGSRNIAGESIILQFVNFKPGALQAYSAWEPYAESQGITSAPHFWSQLDSSFGWPSVIVLVTPHPLDLKGAPNTITDFCSDLGTGSSLLANPLDNACTPSTNVGNPTLCPVDAACTTAGSTCPEFPTFSPPATTPDESDCTGGPGSCTRGTSPPANTGMLGTNTHFYVGVTVSHRDADDDGISNYLETCPFNATPTFNPRVASNPTTDPDGDGIPVGEVEVSGTTEAATSTTITDNSPSATPFTVDALIGMTLVVAGQRRVVTDNTADTVTVNTSFSPPLAGGGGDSYQVRQGCDWNAPGGTSLDEDGDNFQNRGDNCPNVSNGNLDPYPGIGFNNSAESALGFPADGGPRGDDIGDACDPDDDVPDGHYHVDLDFNAICMDDGTGDPEGAADSTPTTDPAPGFPGDPRSTWCTETLALLGASSPPEHLGMHYGVPWWTAGSAPVSPASAGPAQPCVDGVNNDADGGSDATEPDGSDVGSELDCDGTGDIDQDGFSDAVELAIGTDPRYGCSQTVAGQDVGFHDAWPADIFIGSPRFVNFQDLNAMVPALFTSPGNPAYVLRMDIFEPGLTGTIINFQDLNELVPILFTSCSPYAES